MTEVGTTAIQVSPNAEEQEMLSVQRLLQRAADTVVNASKLKTEVEELRATVEALRRDLEDFRQKNAWLDESLVRVRQERDQALGEAATLRTENASLQTQMANANTRMSFLESDLK